MNGAKIRIDKTSIPKKIIKNGPYADLLSRLLFLRGIKTEKDASEFLSATIRDLHSPSSIQNIEKAHSLVKEAISKGKKFFVFGDYDADGITGTAIMYLTLKDLGADVEWRLPDRLTEGYGMSIGAVEELYQRGCQVIVTIDNGIRANKEIALAKSYGMEVVVIDHHVPGDSLPEADVILNLLVHGETYPFTALAGCGLALKVSCFLYERFGFGDRGLKHIDLAAIGTVADVVPLVGENRIIVKEGLNAINDMVYDRCGILSLLNIFDVEPGYLDSTGIGFKVGPALNAPGRLLKSGADKSLRLLLSENPDEATELALELYEINEERKRLTGTAMDAAEEYIINNKLNDKNVMVLLLPGVPEGLVGLVSGRITEKYNRPSLVFSDGAHGCYKGSGRSTEKFNLYDALCACDDLFLKYGGHAQAAGMTIVGDNEVFKKLDERINNYADKVWKGGFEKEIIIAEVLDKEDLTFLLTDTLQKLEPYGKNNERPIFLVKNYCSRKKNKSGMGWLPYAYMGRNSEHLKIFGLGSEAIGFNMAGKFEEMGKPRMIDVLFSLSVNRYQGSRTIQLECLDFCESEQKPALKPTDLMKQMAEVTKNI